MIEDLKKIAAQMETWTPQDGDIEMAHGEADGLLVMALLLIARHRLNSTEIEVVRQIVTHYNHVPKWYA